MVFVALPALQRNQRDTQRRNDAALVKTALENYKANNRGKYPWSHLVLGESAATIPKSDLDFFVNRYLDIDGKFTSPTGEEYAIYGIIFGTFSNAWGFSGDGTSRINIFANANCASGGNVGWLSGARASKNKYAIRIGLETGKAYCLEG